MASVRLTVKDYVLFSHQLNSPEVKTLQIRAAAKVPVKLTYSFALFRTSLDQDAKFIKSYFPLNLISKVLRVATTIHWNIDRLQNRVNKQDNLRNNKVSIGKKVKEFNVSPMLYNCCGVENIINNQCMQGQMIVIAANEHVQLRYSKIRIGNNKALLEQREIGICVKNTRIGVQKIGYHIFGQYANDGKMKCSQVVVQLVIA
uniref:Uncharacterized protein n=1 Tax=Heterorhabditis bacteriophora TaxID=37862 RepID=A0A1I7X6V8_HETBA